MATVFYSPEERVERLRGQLRGTASAGRAGRLASAPPEVRLLWGTLLRGAARLDAGLELTDLEERLVRPLRWLLSEDEVREMGRVFTEETSVRGAEALFPRQVDGQDLSRGYRAEDLFRDLPTMADVSKQPNVQLVDVSTADGQWDDERFLTGTVDAGWGVTAVTASAPPPETAAGDVPIHVAIDCESFDAVHDTGEATSDEIYWVLSAGGDEGVKKSHKTGEYGDTDTGETKTMGVQLFDGAIDKTLACHIQCWEADDSTNAFYNELVSKMYLISDELLAFAEAIKPYPHGNWENTQDWIGLASMIAYTIAALLAFFRNDDDLVQERAIVFDRGAITTLIEHPEQRGSWMFAGAGGGRIRLNLKWRGRGDDRLLTTTTADGDTWTTDTPLPHGGTVAGPALAAHDGKLYCMIRAADHSQRLFWTTLDRDGWKIFNLVDDGGARSSYAPALASHDGILYGAHTGAPDLAGNVWWNRFSNGQWTDFQRIPTNSLRDLSTDSPALASHQGKLYCAFTTLFGGMVMYRYDGTGWERDIRFPTSGVTESSLALASHNGNLYAVHRAQDSTLHWARRDASTWTSWGSFAHGATRYAPSLAVHNGTLYCAIRGSARNESLYYSTYDDRGDWSNWSVFHRLDASSWAAPAIASHDGRLHCVHRG